MSLESHLLKLRFSPFWVGLEIALLLGTVIKEVYTSYKTTHSSCKRCKKSE